MKTTYGTAAAAKYSTATKQGCLMSEVGLRRRVRKAFCGSKVIVRRLATGKNPRKLCEPSSTAGSARVIYIVAIAKGTGFTWVAATTASNRAGNGCRRLRLKAF